MALNMGEPGIFKYQNRDGSYVQYERIYLIMDLAQLGSLKEYIQKYLEPTERIKLVNDCFAGLYSIEIFRNCINFFIFQV